MVRIRLNFHERVDYGSSNCVSIRASTEIPRCIFRDYESIWMSVTYDFSRFETSLAGLVALLQVFFKSSSGPKHQAFQASFSLSTFAISS